MKLTRKIATALGYGLVKKSGSHAWLEGHLKRVLDRLEVNCVIDVGANEGQYARLLRSLGYGGRIVSFEPIRASYEVLARACARDASWIAYDLALGRREAIQSMNVTNASLLASHLAPNDFARKWFAERAEVVRTEEVKVARLDAMFDEIVRDLPEPRAFLKMDTQGSDLEVFAGAQGCLEQIQGIQSELSVLPLYAGMPDYLAALMEYRKHGFEVTGFYPVFRDRDTLVLGELDCVMVRR